MAESTFLSAYLEEEQQWEAIRQNANAWYERLASASESGSEPNTKHIRKILATPEYATLPSASANTEDAQLDELLDWYRQRSDPKPVILYYLSMEVPTELGAKLLARGASPNWRPHWMWCDLHKPIDMSSVPSAAAEADVRVAAKVAPAEHQIQTVDQVIAEHPEEVHRIAAFRDAQIIGACVLNFTRGSHGIGGLFDMEVDAVHRRKGIGTALTIRAVQFAKAAGVRYVYLNATPEARGVYRGRGFQSIGDGWSWHLPTTFKDATKPSKEQVCFLEAVMLGNVGQLDSMNVGGSVIEQDMESRTANGLTAIELAVLFERPESVRWLIDHGATADIVSLWDLGWKDQAKQLIEQQPQIVNRKAGQNGATALHIAVQRNGEELADSVLRSEAIDFSITDDTFESSASGWASFLGRTRMLEVLTQLIARPASSGDVDPSLPQHCSK